MAVDEAGRPRRLIVTAGQRGDAPVAPDLLAGFAPTTVLADTAYDSDSIRRIIAQRGATGVIPNNPTRKHPHPFDRVLYRARNAIERTFARLKDWRRLSTRYDKLALTFRATAVIAAVVCYWL